MTEPQPLAAKSWIISPDYRVFTFKIDTDRKFSDGIKLSAHHFKESWERGLGMAPLSATSSVRDVLYKVAGFSSYASTKTLSGVVAKDDETLEVTFEKPFRIALDYLPAPATQPGDKKAAIIWERVSTLLNLKATPANYASKPIPFLSLPADIPKSRFRSLLPTKQRRP